MVCLLPFSISKAKASDNNLKKQQVFEAKCYSPDGHLVYDENVISPEYSDNFVTFIELKSNLRNYMFLDCDLITKDQEVYIK